MPMDLDKTQEFPLEAIRSEEGSDALWKREGGHLRMQVQAAREIILTFDADGVIRFANQSGLDMTGYMAEELVGMKIADIFPPDDLARIEKGLSLRSGADRAEITIPESRFIDRELALIPVEIQLLARFHEGVRQQAILIARNISDRLRLERERRRRAKSALVRRFAEGVIDDLDKLLENTLSDLEFALSTIDTQNTLFRRIADARKDCAEALRRVRRLVPLAKPPEIESERASLRDLLQRAVEKATNGSDVKCEFWLPDTLWPVKGDETLLTRALEQVIRNAVESMQGRGVIQIRADNGSAGPDLPGEFAPKGAFVGLSIKDRGKGLRPEDLEAAVEPYFSTRTERDGPRPGLGLAFADAVVQAHGGRLDLFSESGLWTLARVLLPAWRKSSADMASRKSPDSGTGPPSGEKRGRVLIMDDEPIVREVASDMLAGLGYDATVVAGAEAAIARFTDAASAGKPYHAVILDLNPGEGGRGGRTVLDALAKIDARVRGIAASGYSNDPEMTDFGVYGFKAALRKPFTRQDLADALAAALSE